LILRLRHSEITYRNVMYFLDRECLRTLRHLYGYATVNHSKDQSRTDRYDQQSNGHLLISAAQGRSTQMRNRCHSNLSSDVTAAQSGRQVNVIPLVTCQ